MDARKLRIRKIAVVTVSLLLIGTFLSYFITPAVSDARTRRKLGLSEDDIVTDTARSPWIYANEDGGITLFTDHMVGMDAVIIPDAVNGVLVTGFDHFSLSPTRNIRLLVFPKNFSVCETPRIWFGKWSALEVIAFEEGVTDLSGMALYDLPALKALYLPKSMTGMYPWGINSGCSEELVIYYAGTEEEWEALGTFSKTMSGKFRVVFETPVPTVWEK